MEPTTPLAQLFAYAFPSWMTLPDECSIRDGMPDGWDHTSEIRLVEAIDAGGGRDDFVAELRRQHPVDGREHLKDHDAGFWRAYLEGAAFAWAFDSAALGAPRFVPFDPAGPGEPDVYVPASDLWIEVKTIGLSRAGQALEDWLFQRAEGGGIPMVTGTISRDVPVGFVNKLDKVLADAEDKTREPSGRLLLFIGMAIDFGLDRDAVRRATSAWADRTARERGVAVVLCHRTEWHNPFHVAWS